MRLLPAIFVLVSFFARSQEKDSFFLARTTGKFTQLAYGLGEDRLGGAKSGYIDTNVLLKVVDSTAAYYKVKLSGSHYGYVDKFAVAKDTVTTVRPFYLTGSFAARGDEAYDYVTISMDEKLPYKSWMEINPSKIFIDVYGVQSNTNWITQLKTAKEISAVYFNQVEDDVVRVTIELVHKQHWGYSINYRNRLLSVRVRRQPRSLKVSKLLIAIDPGHGGINEGALGITSKVLEKNYTIRFANELENYLRSKGANVVMTRTSDTTLSNTDRVLMLQNVMPHFLISLHLNSSANPLVHGVSTYYKHIGYKSFTRYILDRLLQLRLAEFGNVGSFNFTLNAPTDFPNSLVEVAFLSNPEDEKLILNTRFQRAVAKKIYKGIKDWLKEVR